MKKRSVFFIILFAIYNLNAQTKLSDPNLIKYIENQVSKNIFIYRIMKSPLMISQYGSGAILKSSYLSIEAPFAFNLLLPDYGEKLVLQIFEMDMQYPDTNYKLYSVFKPSESYSSMVDSFPHIYIDSIRGITIFHDPNGVPPKVYNNSNIHVFVRPGGDLSKSTWSNDFSTYLGAPDRMFLIGIDTTKGFKKVKYISGNFYLHTISEDFELDINKPESFYEYLTFKTFKYQTEDIRFLEKKDNELIFEAYNVPRYIGKEHTIPENAIRKNLVHIFVDINNVEDVKVKFIYD